MPLNKSVTGNSHAAENNYCYDSPIELIITVVGNGSIKPSNPMAFDMTMALFGPALKYAMEKNGHGKPWASDDQY